MSIKITSYSKQIILVIFFLASSYMFSHVYGQTKDDLRSKKRKTEQEIKLANTLLQQTKRKKQSGYNQLVIINKKITIQEELILTIGEEIDLIIRDITNLQDTVFIIERELLKLKKEYAELLKQSYKRRNKYENLLFIFTAKDFNQAYNRLKYIQQYEKYREKKAEDIKDHKRVVTNKLKQLSLLKAEKQSLLGESESEVNNLTVSKSNQSVLISSLKKKEKQLKAQIAKKKRQARKIENEIKKIIEEEIRKAEELAKKNNLSDLLLTLTPEEKLISNKFEENKTRLPWPTERGIITSKYGRQEHSILKGIYVENNGIDISTTEKSYARTIFKGKVTAISYIDGINNIVLVKHGNYYTVYTNLVDVMVNVNEEVKEKQLLGKIYTDKEKDNKTYMNFQIWKGREKLNPTLWIAH